MVAETGGVLIHPYDNPHVIAGQGTVALELLEQVPDLDAVITPVGGGGLLAIRQYIYIYSLQCVPST